MKIIIIAILALILGACTPSRLIGAWNAADAAAEREVDAVLGFVRQRLCRLPIDVLNRARTSDRDLGRALYYACPEVREFIRGVQADLGQP